MGDDARERLRRRLQRYRQHHESSCCRYDNYINSVTEQQREQTKILHKRWLESQYSVSRKRLKLTVVDEDTVASTSSSMNCTSKSLLWSTTANCAVLPSNSLAPSKLQPSSTDSACCIDTRNVSCLSVPVSANRLQPAVGGIISDCDSLAADVQSKVISNACESILEDCCSAVWCNESSNSEPSCDTVTACQASYCML